MATTAWKKPGSATTVSVGGATWSNPTRITADDNSDATSAMTSGNFSDVIVGYNYGFTTSDVPSGATIDSINFRFEGLKTTGAGTLQLIDGYLYSNTGGTPSEDALFASGNFSPSVSAITSRTLYTASNILGSAGLTDSAVRSSGFGIGLGFLASGGAATAGVDYFEVSINYTPAANPVPVFTHSHKQQGIM